ncbi:hypothetical protein DP107_09410 [Haloglomus irregulare]|uniref:DUF2238 domain-containing protein n=1 Tax=Haloglomus irregulare TaxID=2234134 RepID=A0A554NA64_9EURY|nr:hypothetical protein [Haloglomus irregulare]TSD13860.1 hypothetical protein DP107_09410 [Haloglomus irregulare]
MRLRDRVGIDAAAQARVAWGMELVLLGILVVGIWDRNTGIIVNTAVGLAVTQLVPLLERDYDIPMDPALTLWITGAVFLHAVGVIGVPGSPRNLYASVWWYDHVTHALSASVVAAAGYATARAIDLHTEEVRLPPRFMFVFILLVTLAFGVLWEVIEFVIGEIAATVGGGAILTQYGLGDSMLDLVFDSLGAVVVAVWGTAYLTDVAGALADRLAEDPDDRGSEG